MRGGRFPAGVVIGLLLAACSGESGLNNAEGLLQVAPTRLTFANGYVGHAVETRIRLQNTGRTELLVQLAIEGPFQTEEGPYRLPGGADVTRPVRFTPASPGEFEGLLRYTQGEQVVEVPLAGTAVIPEVCVAPGPCFESWFEPASGGCITRALDEGASCQTGNACLVDGICVNQECRGTVLDCNDGNACTEDRCDPAVGCRHDPIVCTVPDDEDPRCREAICKPDQGCDTRDKRDGTSCGDNSTCVARYYCFAGTCDTRSAEGLPCAARCGDGVCRDEVCTREQENVVDPPLFVSSVPPDWEIAQFGLTAGDGTLLWIASAIDGTRSYLYALTPDGGDEYVERYRGIPLGGPLGAAGAMVAGEVVVAALADSAGGPVIEARWIADGELAWQWSSLQAVRALIAEGNQTVRVVLGASGSTGVVSVGSAGPGPITWLAGEPIAGPGEPVAVADADGRLFLALDAGDAGRTLYSLYGDGSLRWERHLGDDEGGPLAVADGLLVVAPGVVRDTADGEPLFDLPVLAGAGLAGPSPLLGSAVGYAVQGGDETTPPSLVAFDPANGEPFGSGELVLPGIGGTPSWTAPIRTTRENAVVAIQQDPLGEAMLISGFVEYRQDGELARACLVPGLERLAGPPALRNGRFAFAERRGAVKLYELNRGADAATWGWSGPRGGPAGGNREGR